MSALAEARRPPAATARPAAAATVMGFAADTATFRLLSEVLEGWAGAAIEPGGIEAAIDCFAAEASPPYLLVDLAGVADPLGAIGRLADVCAPATELLAIGEANDITLYRALRAAGVSDYLVKPLTAQAIAGALAALQQGPAGKGTPRAAQPESVIAVVGSCGGAGASMVAAGLAWISAEEQRRRTMLVDLDLHYGAAALGLNVAPTHGLCEVLENPGLIDGLLIASAATSLGTQLSLLCSEEPLDSGIDAAPEALAALTAQLRTEFQRIIIEVPRRNLALLRQTLPQAGTIVIVTDPSLIGARDARRMIALARSLAPEARLFLLGNRFGKPAKGMPGRGELEQAMGMNFSAVLPEDEAVPRALAVGKPLPAFAPKSRSAAALRAFAATLAPASVRPRAGRLAQLLRLRKGA